MNQKVDQNAEGAPPKPSTVSSVAGYVLFGILFGVGGMLVIPWSHSILLGVVWIFGGVVSISALWATYQTRLTMHGVDRVPAGGVRL